MLWYTEMMMVCFIYSTIIWILDLCRLLNAHIHITASQTCENLCTDLVLIVSNENKI